MNLQDLFNTVKYGKDQYANMKASSSNSKHIDEDYNLYMVSSRINELFPLLGENTQVKNYVNKMKGKFEEIEKKILDGTFTSSIYSRMKMDSISENYNDFVKLLTENKKISREIDVDILGRIMGSVKAGLKVLSEKSEKEVILESFPVAIERSLNEEFKIIQEILAE